MVTFCPNPKGDGLGREAAEQERAAADWDVGRPSGWPEGRSEEGTKDAPLATGGTGGQAWGQEGKRDPCMPCEGGAVH